MEIALRMDAVGRTHGSGPTAVTALDDVSLDVPAGSFTAVMGPSGSGKSTFLNCAAGLDRPTTGAVTVGGTALAGLDERRLAVWRRDHVGFVFQQFHLLPYLTAAENVELPLRLAGRRIGTEARRRVDDALAAVGLSDRREHLPAQLSGGQQQRVAVARALVTRPQVVFADEPTGALDSTGARRVLDLLDRAVRERGQTVVMVTHDPVAAAHAGTVVLLADGRRHGVLTRPSAEQVAARLARLGEYAAVAR
jgi:putative ABC transport system ATP-binding protein